MKENNLKIEIGKHRTLFYCKKTDHKKLKAIISRFSALRKYLLKWENGRFILRYKVCAEYCEVIRQDFKNYIPPVIGKEIIHGFVGNLITGHGLRFL